MKTRATWNLVLLAAALFVFIFSFERHTRQTADISQPGRVLPDLNTNAVSSVLIKPAGQPEISVERKADTWQITQPVVADAQSSVIENLLQILSQLPWHTRLTAQELQDHPNADREFGFVSPAVSLELQQAGTRRQIKIGSRTALGDEVFVQVAGVNEIYVVTANLLRFIPHTANDWRDPGLVSLNNLIFDRLIVTNGAKVFELQRSATNKIWRMTRPLDARADNPRVEELLRRLQSLRAAQFVTDDPKADLETFGLQPAELVLSLMQGTNTVLALEFGKSPTNHADQVFAKRGDQPGVSRVATESLTPWRAGYEDFRDRHLLDLTGVTVDEIEAHGSGEFTVRRQSNDVWRVTQPEDLPADAALINNLLASLTTLQVTQFVKTVVTEPDLPNYGLAPAASRFILKSGATNAVITELDFSGPADGKVSARRTDETAVYAVPAADLRRLNLAGWQLRDRRLWNFTADDVTRLVLRQRGQTRELLRQATNQWAFAPGSQGVINNFAIEETAHRLGELFADSWVDRGETNRARHGFNGDVLQIAVDVKRGGKAETLTLDFSGVTPQQPPYGATTLDGQVWFFELAPALGEMIRSYLCLPAATP